jgi:hypothetical protein
MVAAEGSRSSELEERPGHGPDRGYCAYRCWAALAGLDLPAPSALSELGRNRRV